jgi:2,4-dienoyl-CoA reductase (NADPH2)
VEAARSNPLQLWLHEGSASAFGRLVGETRRAAREGMGPGHQPLLILQLTHSGRWSKPGGARRPLIAHHVDALDAMVGLDGGHAVVSDEELDRLQDVFVEVARLAAAAGFDGVDVKACHGYLVSELLGAFDREGRYGGPLENRSRLLLETVERVRGEVPGLLVTSRLNAFDGVPHPYGFGADREDPARPELREPILVLERLRALGAPLANITLGVPYRNPHLGRPFNRAVPGSPSAPEHPLVGIERFQAITGALQKALPGLSLVGTGYSWLRHFFPHVGAAAVRRGEVSIVGVGRMAFAYPDFARDLVEHGALDPRKVCVGCSGCSHLMKAGMHAGCVVRDGELYQVPEPPGRKGADP